MAVLRGLVVDGLWLVVDVYRQNWLGGLVTSVASVIVAVVSLMAVVGSAISASLVVEQVGPES